MPKPTEWTIVGGSLDADGESLYNKADHLWAFWENAGTNADDEIGTLDLTLGTGVAWTTDGDSDVCVQIGSGDNVIESSGSYATPGTGALLLVLEHDDLGNGNDRIWSNNNAGGNQHIDLDWDNNATLGQRLYVRRLHGSNVWHNTDYDPTGLTLNGTVSILLEWDVVLDEWELFVNGASVGGRQTGWTTGATETAQNLILGGVALGGAAQFFGKYKLAALLNDLTTAAERDAIALDPYVMIREDLGGGPGGLSFEQVPGTVSFAAEGNPVVQSSGYFHLVPLRAEGGAPGPSLGPPETHLENTTGSPLANEILDGAVVLDEGSLVSGDYLYMEVDDAVVGYGIILNTWPDGSAKHCKVDGIIPSIPASGSKEIVLKASDTPPPGTNVAVGDFPADFDCRIELNDFRARGAAAGTGVDYYAVLKPLLTGTPTVFSTSPTQTTWIIGADITDGVLVHDQVKARFYVTLFNDGTVKVRPVTEYCWGNAGTRPGSNTRDYDIVIKLGTAEVVVYSQTGVEQRHNSKCGKEVFWWRSGAEYTPQSHFNTDPQYLIDSKAVANYPISVLEIDDGSNVIHKTLPEYLDAADSVVSVVGGNGGSATPSQGFRSNGKQTRNGWAGIELLKANQPNATWNECFGPMPRFDVIYLIATRSGTPESTANKQRLWDHCMRSGTAHATFEKVLMNSVTDELALPSTGWDKNYMEPDASPSSAGGNVQPETSHGGGPAYLPYLLSGDPYLFHCLDIDMQLHWLWAQSGNPSAGGSVQDTAGVVADGSQARALAWCWRDYGNCGFAVPDGDPRKAAIDAIISDQIDYWYEQLVDPGTSKMSAGIYPWERTSEGLNDWVTQLFTVDWIIGTLHRVFEQKVGDNTKVQAIRDYGTDGMMQRMTSDDWRREIFQIPVKIRDAENGNLYDTLAEVAAETFLTHMDGLGPSTHPLVGTFPSSGAAGSATLATEITERTQQQTGGTRVYSAGQFLRWHPKVNQPGHPAHGSAYYRMSMSQGYADWTISTCVDAGEPGAAAAWTTWETRPTPSDTVFNTGGAHNLQYRIVPRT